MFLNDDATFIREMRGGEGGGVSKKIKVADLFAFHGAFSLRDYFRDDAEYH